MRFACIKRARGYIKCVNTVWCVYFQWSQSSENSPRRSFCSYVALKLTSHKAIRSSSETIVCADVFPPRFQSHMCNQALLIYSVYIIKNDPFPCFSCFLWPLHGTTRMFTSPLCTFVHTFNHSQPPHSFRHLKRNKSVNKLVWRRYRTLLFVLFGDNRPPCVCVAPLNTPWEA